MNTQLQHLIEIYDNIKDDKLKDNIDVLIRKATIEIMTEVYIHNKFIYDEDDSVIGQNY